jgi:hypothetical protein
LSQAGRTKARLILQRRATNVVLTGSQLFDPLFRLHNAAEPHLLRDQNRSM